MAKYSSHNLRGAVLAPASVFKNDHLWSDRIGKDFYQNNVWVLNPMHIVNLSKQTKSKFVKFVEAIKRFSEKWFSHVLLLVFLILYGFLGAYIFQMLEAPLESTNKDSVINMRDKIIKELWWSSQKFNKGWWSKLAYIRMKEFERQLHESCISGVTTSSDSKVWTFWGALFFSSTIFTTIGYGNIVPKTNAGRVATIIYAFIGIPLLLMVLADFGKLLTRGIKAIFKSCRDFYYQRTFRRVRRVGRRATAVPSQYMTMAVNAMNRRLSSLPVIKAKKDSENANDKTEVKVKIEEDPKEKKKIRKEFPYKPNTSKSQPIMPSQPATSSTPEPENFEVDDEFNLPISVAIALLLSYMMLGAAVFTLWENWSFFESFYFVYISLSTIGFGDYVPKHPVFMIATFIYLLFGLALTSMCINVVQEKLSATFQKAKMRIGETVGLDVEQIMAEDIAQEEDAKEKPKENPKPKENSKKILNQSKKPNEGFVLKEHGIGNSLKERREKRHSPNPDGKSSNDDEKDKTKGKSVKRHETDL